MDGKGTWTRKKKAIAGCVAVAVVAAMGLGAMTVMSKAGNEVADAEIVTDTVQRGTISEVVTGTGSLSADETVNVLVPADLMVEQVLVEKGDVIDVGTPIATVSAASVRQKLLTIEENIDSLQKELDNLSGSTEHYDLKRSVLEDQIADLKSDQAAMQGLLETLTLTSDSAGVVSNVSIFDNTATGKVSLREQQGTEQQNGSGPTSSSDQEAMSPDSSEQASATPESGTAGTALYVPQNASAMTARYVPNTDSSTTDARHTTLAAETSDNQQEDALFSTQDEGQSDMADGSAIEATDADGAVDDPAEEEPQNGSSDDPETQSGETPQNSDTPDPVTPNPAEDEPTQIYGTIELSITAPSTGATPQATSGIEEDENRFEGRISWAPESDTFAPATEYVATIYLTTVDGYCFSPDPSNLDISMAGCTDLAWELHDLDDDGYKETLKIMACFPATAQPKDQNQNAHDGALSSDDLSGFGGISLGGGSDADANSLTKPGSSYSDTEAIALAVTPSSKMFLDVKIDELDITNLAVGQQANVTLDAMPDETLVGTIVSIENTSQEASKDGGSTKYLAHIELPFDDRMRYGMSAKAEITVGEAKDVPTVPIDAISDLDGNKVVYTAVDKDGALTSPVQVETGLSDGDNVEVKSGLDVGDTICYTPSKEGDDELYYY